MIRLFPIKVLRAAPEYVSKVSARSNSGESDAKLFEILETNPFSYLHIVKPYIHFGVINKRTADHYPFARNYFKQLISQEVLLEEENRYLFIYELVYANGQSFKGIIGGLSVLDYLEGKIKKHENTRKDKEERLVKHIDTIGAVGEPVLMAMNRNQIVDDWIQSNSQSQTMYDFLDELQCRHRVWKIDDADKVSEIQNVFSDITELYIADGHHRIAASAEYCVRMHSAKGWKVKDMVMMGFILPQDQLVIKSFHRTLLGIAPDKIEVALEQLKAIYQVEKSAVPVIPEKKGEVGLLCQHGWYKCTLPDLESKVQGLSTLDVHRVEEDFFKNALGIKNSREDVRIGYLNGDTPVSDLQSLLTRGDITAALTFFPCSMTEIEQVADREEVMPPKSTWIEPKLLTGMIIQPFL